MLETVIIGAGQAGLCTSFHLKRRGVEHVVLERDSVASSWKRRWDSFTLVSPNGMNTLPGFAAPGEPDAFMTRDDVIAWIRAFAASFEPPLRTGVTVTRVQPLPDGEGYEVVTDDGAIRARCVVIATGGFQRPRVPIAAQRIDARITQLHSDGYRSPSQLPDGGVLVVGSGQSGAQIADELRHAGRRVHLSVGSAVRLPRRYRGRDIFFWARDGGMLDRTVDDLDSPGERFDANPHVSGAGGGRTLNLRRFGREGVVLLGRVEAANGTRLRLAGDVEARLAAADAFAAELCARLDAAVAAQGLQLPDPTDDELVPDDWTPGSTPRELDLDAHGISSIIWATGYGVDFSWVCGLDIDEYGYPIQRRGICRRDGLYVVGLPWLHSQKSGLLYGVGDDAAHVADAVAARREARLTLA